MSTSSIDYHSLTSLSASGFLNPLSQGMSNSHSKGTQFIERNQVPQFQNRELIREDLARKDREGLAADKSKEKRYKGDPTALSVFKRKREQVLLQQSEVSRVE